jgi:hypothetical protein
VSQQAFPFVGMDTSSKPDQSALALLEGGKAVDILPTVALSIQQPWAWLIANGHKDIENRSWRTKFRGPVLIHAGVKVDDEAEFDVVNGFHPVTGHDSLKGNRYPATLFQRVPRGGIIGVAEVVDCISRSDSEWFVGPFGFVLANARPLPFIPCKGQLGFFTANLTETRL